MTKLVGGRGHKAPYETTHLRVPVPLKGDVEKLIEAYRAQVLGGEDIRLPYKNTSSGCNLDLEAAKGLAQKLLRAKASKIETMAKLLSAIYGEDIAGSDLLE